MQNDYFNKYLTVDILLSFLEHLPKDWLVVPNKVGNLALYNKDNVFVGFIDFLLNGEVELVDKMAFTDYADGAANLVKKENI